MPFQMKWWTLYLDEAVDILSVVDESLTGTEEGLLSSTVDGLDTGIIEPVLDATNDILATTEDALTGESDTPATQDGLLSSTIEHVTDDVIDPILDGSSDILGTLENTLSETSDFLLGGSLDPFSNDHTEPVLDSATDLLSTAGSDCVNSDAIIDPIADTTSDLVTTLESSFNDISCVTPDHSLSETVDSLHTDVVDNSLDSVETLAADLEMTESPIDHLVNEQELIEETLALDTLEADALPEIAENDILQAVDPIDGATDGVADLDELTNIDLNVI